MSFRLRICFMQVRRTEWGSGEKVWLALLEALHSLICVAVEGIQALSCLWGAFYWLSRRPCSSFIQQAPARFSANRRIASSCNASTS